MNFRPTNFFAMLYVVKPPSKGHLGITSSIVLRLSNLIYYDNLAGCPLFRESFDYQI